MKRFCSVLFILIIAFFCLLLLPLGLVFSCVFGPIGGFLSFVATMKNSMAKIYREAMIDLDARLEEMKKKE